MLKSISVRARFGGNLIECDVTAFPLTGDVP